MALVIEFRRCVALAEELVSSITTAEMSPNVMECALANFPVITGIHFGRSLLCARIHSS